jgi:hypothetical protein
VIQNRPSSVADQLFQWVQESIREQNELNFNSRLLRYGQAFTKFLRNYESVGQSGSISSHPGVRSQFLRGYEELYRTALSQNESQKFRNRLVQSLIYALRVSFEEELFDSANMICEKYENIVETELNQTDTSEVVLNHIEEIETPFIAAVNQFLDKSSQNQGSSYSVIFCHSLINNLMELSAQYHSRVCLSELFDIYDDTLSKATLDNRIRRMWENPENIPTRVRSHQERLKVHERVRGLDLIGRCLRYYEADNEARLDVISEIRKNSNFDSDISGLFDSMYFTVDSDIELEWSDRLSTSNTFKFVRQGPDASSWRARAYLLEFLRLGWSNQNHLYKFKDIGIPSSPEFKEVLKRVRRAHNWPELESIPIHQFLQIDERESSARLFMSAESHQRAFESAQASSIQKLRNSELSDSLVEDYRNSRNLNANRHGLIKYLRDRGNIQIKSHGSSLQGVPVVQYYEPKEMFVEGYAEEFASATGPDRNSIIQNGYSRYLLNNSFRKSTVDSQSKLKEAIDKSAKKHLSDDPVIIEDLQSDLNLFDNESEWEKAETPHEDMGIIKKWNSIPIFSESLNEFDAVVVYGTSAKVVEFRPDSGIYNIEVQPAKKEYLLYGFHDSVPEENLEKCVVTVRIRFGLRSKNPLGLAIRISD